MTSRVVRVQDLEQLTSPALKTYAFSRSFVHMAGAGEARYVSPFFAAVLKNGHGPPDPLRLRRGGPARKARKARYRARDAARPQAQTGLVLRARL